MAPRAALPRRPVAVLLAAVLTVACGSSTTSPSPTPTVAPTPTAAPTATGGSSPAPSDDLDAVYAEIEAQVVALRGLEARRPVDPRIVAPDEMAEILRSSVEEDAPPELLAAYERLYVGMGLMSEADDLEAVYVDLLESQVGGLYVPADELLYVVSREGEVGAVERVLFAHEFVHALQDQHFDLERFQDGLTDQTDRQLARLALTEGDAYTAMTYWTIQHLGPDGIRELLEYSNDPEALAALERIPPIVQASVLFAATQGTEWVLRIQASGGWEAIDAAWERPPESTEQILHLDKYEASEGPIEVAMPADLAEDLGPGWSVQLEDTFGEHQLSIWLAGTDAPSAPTASAPPAAAEAAAGWGGDRVALLAGPDGATAVVLMTEWDTAADAGEFAEQAEAAMADLGVEGIVALQPRSTRATVLIGSDADVVLDLDRILGHTGA
jgi:hypothetical protein